MQALRLRLTNLLYVHRTVGLWFLDALEIVALVAYLLYLLVRGRSTRFRAEVLGYFQLVSMLALGSALLYKHFTRLSRHVHIRRDWRLLYLGLAQVAQACALALHKRLPLWQLEAVALLAHALMVVSAGHERVQDWVR
jgi:hypothetical protein